MTRGLNCIALLLWSGMLVLAQGCDQTPEVRKKRSQKTSLEQTSQETAKHRSDSSLIDDDLSTLPALISDGSVSVPSPEPAAILPSVPSLPPALGALPPPPPPLIPAPVLVPPPEEFDDSDDFDDSQDDSDFDDAEDDGELEPEFGVCGNGIQEVLESAPQDCKYLLYGSTITQPNGTSTLVYLDEETGKGTSLGTITNIHSVSAIDFSPQGVLYGIGLANSASGNIAQNQSVLAKINCSTTVATIIGATNIDTDSVVTDINFDWQGELFAYVQTPTPGESYVGTVDILTGEITPLPNPTGDTDLLGNGIAFSPFRVDILFHADEADLSIINLITGIEDLVDALGNPASLTSMPRINAMDLDPFTGILYVSIEEDKSPTNVLGVLHTSTSIVSFLTEEPFNAPAGLNGLAVNRRYEECDTGGNTPACLNCQAHETDCNNSLDDDFDGLTDCADSDCVGNTCDDGNGCTTSDVCTAQSVCQGTPNTGASCDDDNPCTADDECTAQGLCQGEDSNGAPCNDFNDCTDDICQDGECMSANVADGTLCGDFIDVCVELTCQDGECEITAVVDPCEDMNPCTIDFCEIFAGCSHESLADFTPGGGPCTVPNAVGVCAQGAFVCLDGSPSDRCASLFEPSTEVCNGLDDDCDGSVDESLDCGP